MTLRRMKERFRDDKNFFQSNVIISRFLLMLVKNLNFQIDKYFRFFLLIQYSTSSERMATVWLRHTDVSTNSVIIQEDCS